MKGILLPFATTLAVILVGVAICVGALFIYLMTQLSGTELSNRFDFTTVVTRPYDVTLLSEKAHLDNRTISERSLETALTLKASSDFSDLKYMLDIYKIEYFFFYIYTDDRYAANPDVFYMDNVAKRCGENSVGFCVSPNTTTNNKAGVCGVGRVRIDDRLMCLSTSVCCEENIDKYLETPGSYTREEIIMCGGDMNGYCTSSVERANDPTQSFTNCGAGRFRYKEGEATCENVNSGETPLCCVPMSAQPIEAAGGGSSAEIPLLYKGETLYEPRNYDCYDTSTTPCAGEFVTHQCQGPPRIQCCVTDEIHCMPPHEEYVCMDRSHCNERIIEEDRNTFCPGNDNNYICCATDEHIHGQEPQSPQSVGSCTLGGDAYNARPFFGKAELFVSGPLILTKE